MRLKPLIIAFSLITALTAYANGYRLTHYDDHNGMSQWHATKMLQDKNGFIWIATWNGLNRYDGYDFAVFKSKPGDGNNLTSDRIRNMLMGDDGNIYCIINHHVWRFNLTTYQFEEPDSITQERYRARINYDTTVHLAQRQEVNGIWYDDARQVMTDAQRNTWVMCSYGVDKISPMPQPAYRLPEVPTDIVRCMYRDRSKRIWITSRNTGTVTVLDSVANLIGYLGKDGRLHKEHVTFVPIYCMYQQKDGTIWLGSKPHGLFRMHETAQGGFAMENFPKGTPEQIRRGTALNCTDIYDIKEDRKGRLWIATQGGGINLIENPKAQQLRFLNPENTFTNYPEGNMFMRRLLMMNDDIILATTTEGFIVMTDVMKKPKEVGFNLHLRESNRASSLSCSAIMDILIDRKGRLFLTTESGGVNMLLTKNLRAKQFDFAHYDTSNGMGSDVALAMKEVGDEILIQCNNQVTRLNADLDRIENFNSLFFTFPARFSDAEPILLTDGRWLLSLENGVIAIPEQAFHQRSYIPRIVLTSIAIPGSAVRYAVAACDTLRLSSSERDVSITYAALDFSDNSHIKYVTRLSETGRLFHFGDTSKWTTPQEIRTTNLYNLSPGTYTLEIRSTNAEGLWTENTRTLTIIVEPTFWETPIAYIIYIILTILLISGITYTVVYIRNLERQREENLQAYLRLFEAQNNNTAASATASNSAGGPIGNDSETDENGASQPTTTTEVVSHLSPEDDAFMRRLLTFVEENLGDSNVGVDEMAAATATSRSSLNRKTKSLLGVTPADFLREARMKRACQQLTTTMRGVNDIAYSCGFSDPKYFSKCFKASIGMSPSEYRQHKNDA